MQNSIIGSSTFHKQNQEQQITPDLAAQIVRHYILPMFEQKLVRKNGKNVISSSKFKIYRNQSDKQINSNSVYGELKLSDMLQKELSEVKNLVDILNEQIEE